MKGICRKTYTSLTILILTISTAYTYNGIEGYIPDGAIQRFGKGYSFDIDYSPDGSLLAVASTIGIWLYDVKTRKEIKFLTGHTHFINSIVFSPNGKNLASGSSGGTILVWNVEEGEVITTLKGHTDEVYSLAFSPDGNMLVSGSEDELIKIWNLKDSKAPITIPGHIDGVTYIAISPDGNLLASSGRSVHRISLWNLKNGKFHKFLSGHKKDINSIAFTSDGTTLVSGSDDGTIRFWNTKEGNQLKTYEGILAILSPDGNRFASYTSDGIVRIWDIQSGNLLCSTKPATENVYDMTFSHDGRTITANTGLELHFWNVETGHLIDTIIGYSQGIDSLKYTHNGQTLVSVDDYIKIWDLTNSKLQKSLSLQESISSISLVPDNDTIAIGDYDNLIYLWDMNTDMNKVILKGHKAGIASVAFSPDGKKLASSSWDDSIRLWDSITGEHITTVTEEAFSSRNIDFSKDGNSLVFIDRNSSIIFWNLDTLNIEKDIDLDSNYPYSMALSPDGKIIAVGYDNEEIHLFDVSTEEVVRTIQTVGRTDKLDFSPDGQTLAGCGSEVYLWDVNTGKLIDTLTGHTNQVFTIAFSPDGKTLASGGWDSTIIIWEIKFK
ncbi:hypothetical protein C6497_07705 [Candidatus Poribacteria bacterium]|nr:MAG: hypothetical protein C6497_07705 [Candidatus Poribacteria bacterium]